MKLKYDERHSNFAFNVHLRHYSKGEAAQSQLSNHALMGSSGMLLARVNGLDARAMRRGAVPAGGMVVKEGEPGGGDMSARRVLYGMAWDVAPPRPVSAAAIPGAGRLNESTSAASAAGAAAPQARLSSVRATAGAVQALQARASGGGAAVSASALHTSGSHPHRATGTAPRSEQRRGGGGAPEAAGLWGVWAVAAAEAPSSWQWAGADSSTTVNTADATAATGGEDRGGGLHGAVSASGAWATPRLAALDVEPRAEPAARVPPGRGGRRALITGGLGSVALIAAAWLAGRASHKHVHMLSVCETA